MGSGPRRSMTRSGVTDHLNRVAKYVVSRTLDDLGWAGLGQRFFAAVTASLRK